MAPSATALTTMALRAALEAAVMRAALDDHYAQHPEARPDLADIAIAAAEIDGSPLAADPERIRRAAAEIAATHPDPEPEDSCLGRGEGVSVMTRLCCWTTRRSALRHPKHRGSTSGGGGK